MERVIVLAERLGQAIAETERFVRLREAEKAVRASAEARKALDDCEAYQRVLARKEAERRPIEPEEKHRLADLEATVHGNATLQDLARAQADYMEMMNRVNQAIRARLDVDEKTAG
jgi:cell fate (sporulation/competence/biofilm development) regulator YlbF (YheA/YmcA/DUF963 family)